jgi:hypothetical protein
MMKKIVMLLAVAAMTCFSTSAFAVHEGEGKAAGNLADITIGGSIDIRSRDFTNLDFNKNVGDATLDTQERVRIDVNAKAGDVKGKVTIENDWDTWGRNETPQANAANNTGTSGTLDLREAWVLFPVPSTPVMVKGGHMLLQLGQGWWFRSMKYGSDAWVAFADFAPAHVGLVDVKLQENLTSTSDDVDAYVLFATVKASDTMTFGADVTYANDRRNKFGLGSSPTNTTTTDATQAYNIGLNFDGKLGPVGLKAEADIQTGKAKGNDKKFKGNQIVAQGNVAMDPVTINFTAAYGSGRKAGENDYKQMVTFLDADQHYTFLYEYKVAGPCGIHSGFCGTTAISAGAMFAATTSLSIGADVWFLQATEKVAEYRSAAANAPTTSELGTEVDVKVNWKLADNLSWNWNLGYLAAGKGLGTADAQGNHKDAALGAQGVLSMKF